MKPLRRVLAELGLREWPSVRATETGAEVAAGRVARDLGESTLFAVSVGWDLANKSANIITVSGIPTVVILHTAPFLRNRLSKRLSENSR